jgi:hypothetical protein
MGKRKERVEKKKKKKPFPKIFCGTLKSRLVNSSPKVCLCLSEGGPRLCIFNKILG